MNDFEIYRNPISIPLTGKHTSMDWAREHERTSQLFKGDALRETGLDKLPKASELFDWVYERRSGVMFITQKRQAVFQDLHELAEILLV